MTICILIWYNYKYNLFKSITQNCEKNIRRRRYFMFDILIIGAGPAGLTAAIYAQRAGLSCKVFDKAAYGGQTVQTSEIENYPGIEQINGVDFAMTLYNQATAFGAEVVMEEITAVDLDSDIKTITTSSGVHQGQSIIIAGGGYHRKLGVPGEEELSGKGVSYCATCDAAFHRGKDVVIVGGGNTALEDAAYLSNICNKVYLIHRRDEFRGDAIAQKIVEARDNIEILYSSQVKAVEGENKVEKCIVNTPNGERTLDITGFFVAVGIVPDTSLYSGKLPLTQSGHIDSGEDCKTPIPGVYVAGDIREKPLYQIVTAASDGAVAASAASSYCAEKKLG